MLYDLLEMLKYKNSFLCVPDSNYLKEVEIFLLIPAHFVPSLGS